MKTILHYAFFALLFFAGTAYSQTGYNVDLLRSGGGTGSGDNAKGVAVDSDGNMYVAGSFASTATFESTSLISAGLKDGYIAKYNATGALQWIKRMGGVGEDEIQGIAILGTDLYVVGYFNETANFNTPSSFVNNVLISAGNSDIFIAKYDLNGNFSWARRAGGTSADYATGVSVSGTDIYLTGGFNATANFNTPSATGSNEITSIGSLDAFIAKFNTSGVLQFARRAGSTGSDIAHGITTALNGIYITGEFTGDAHFNTAGTPGTTSLTSAGNSDVFVAKYDFSGNIQWTRRAGGTSNDIARSIINIGDNVFITGQFWGDANFNTPSAAGSNELTSAGDFDGFFARFDGNGDYAGGRRFGGSGADIGAGICRIGTALYVVGQFNGTANFNQPSASGSNELTTAGNSDMFLARFTNMGAFVWAKRGGGTGVDNAEAVAALNTEVYVSGRYSATANFNTPSSNTTNTLVSTGSYDAFLARFSCIPGAPTGPAMQQFCGANNPTLSNLNVIGTGIKWYSVSTGGTQLNITTALVNGQTYYASQTTAGCEGTERFALTVEVLTTIPAPTGAANQFFCNNGVPNLISSLTAIGQTIQWYANASGGSALSPTLALVNGTTYYAGQTIDGCNSSTRLAVTVTISNVPNTPAATSPQFFCSGSTYTLADVVISGSAIQWYSTSGTTNPIPTTTTLVNGTNYYARNTVNGCQSPPTVVQISIVTQPSAPTGASPQTFCSTAFNNELSSLVVSGTNIQWYASPTGGSPLLNSTNLVNGTTYYASQSNGNCESSARLAVTVNLTVVPAPTGNTPQVFCASQGPFFITNLIATGSNILWYSSIDGTVPSSGGSQISDGSTYYASQTMGGCVSSSRLAVLVTINTTPAPTPETPQLFCASSNPTISNLVASGTNLQWFAAASGGSPLAPSTALVNGNSYYVSQTIGGCASNRFPVSVTLNSNANPPVAPMSQNFCSGNSPTLASVTVTGTNLQWYNAQTGGSTLPMSTPVVNGTAYWVSQTTDCGESNRIGVLVNIYTTPSAPTGNSTQSFCTGTPTIANLQTIPMATSWYALATGGSPLSTSTVLVDGQSYFAAAEYVGCESPRFEVVVELGSAPAAPTGNATQTFCAASGVTYSIQDLVVIGSNINWYYSETGGVPADPTDILGNGGTYYASQTMNGCESTNRLAVTAQIVTTLAPTGASPQSFCVQNSPMVSSLSASGTSITWYNAASGGSVITGGSSLVNGTTYYASQTLNGCPSQTRLAVQAIVTSTPSPTGNTTQQFCSASNPTVGSLYTNESPVTWYNVSTGGTSLATSTLLTNGSTYYGSLTTNGCESTTRLPVTVTFISQAPAPNGLSNQSFCAQNNPTISTINVSGTNIEWFTVPTGGAPIATSTPLVNGVTYYAAQNIGGCASGTRLGVTVTINATPAAPTGVSPQNFCASPTPMLSNVVVNSPDITWYSVASGGTQLIPSTILTNGTTFYAAQTVNGCQSINRLAISIALTPTPSAPTGTFTQYFCSGENPTLASFDVNGTNLTWYTTSNSSTVLPSNTPVQNGILYYASQTINGCESSDRFETFANINPTPNAPTGTATQQFCSSATIADLAATGSAIQWYATNTGGNTLTSSTALTHQTSYFASQTVTGCESVDRFEVFVTITNAPNDAITVNSHTLTAVETNAQYQWMNCATNQPILGESQQSFTATETGIYAVQITKDGCTATSECVEIKIAGISHLTKKVYSMYPNPASNTLFLVGEFSSDTPTLKVMDIAGKDVSSAIATTFSDGKYTISVENLAAGSYYLLITENKISEKLRFTLVK